MNKLQQTQLAQQNNPVNQTVSYSVPKKPQFFPNQNTSLIQNSHQNQQQHHSDKRKPNGLNSQQQPQLLLQQPIQQQPSQQYLNIKNIQHQQSNNTSQQQNIHTKPAAPSTKLALTNKNMLLQQQQQQNQLNKQQIHQQQQYQQQMLQQKLQLNQNYSQQITHPKYQYQTPTSHNQLLQQQPSIMYMNKSSPYREKKRKKKEFNLTCRILEAKLLVSLSKVFNMNVHCQINYNEDIKKTSSQSGKNPKWNESFTFVITEEKQKTQQIEFSVFHKAFLMNEEKIGNTILKLELSQYNLTDWFILQNEKNDVVGSILICILVEETGKQQQPSNQKGVPAGGGGVGDVKIAGAGGENLDDDFGDDYQHSIDLRDHEISRSVLANSKKKKYLGVAADRKGARQNMMANTGMLGSNNNGGYVALQTQQILPTNANGNSYLNTQIPRQSVTEHSIIQLISTHSSNNSLEGQRGGHDQGDHNSGNKINMYNQQMRQQQPQQQQRMYNNNMLQMDDDGLGQLVPQQLFYGNGNGVSNLQQQQNAYLQQLQQLQQQQNKNSQSQFLAMEDLQTNFGQGGIGVSQQQQQQQLVKQNNGHTHKHHHKKRRRKDKLDPQQQQLLHQQQQLQLLQQHQQLQQQEQSRIIKKHNSKQRLLQQQEQELEDLNGGIIGIADEYNGEVLIPRVGDNFDEEQDNILFNQRNELEMMDEEVNYGQYLNQRSHQQLFVGGQGSNQPASSSQSQQMLQAINKVNIGFESGGGSGSGSGGAQQFFNGGNFNLGGGSNGSYIPVPSYFEDQHSIESVNNNNNNGINGGGSGTAADLLNQNTPLLSQQLISNTQGAIPTNLYDISEFQDIEQIRTDLRKIISNLNEENYRVKSQDEKLTRIFEKLKQESLKIQQEKQEVKRLKEQYKQSTKKMDAQKEEIEYQRQQLERGYLKLKKEKIRRSQEAKVMEGMLKTFSELVQKSKLLQNSTAQGYSVQKMDEFVQMIKSVHQMLQITIANNQGGGITTGSSSSQSLIQLQQQVKGQQALQSHIQQESTSSCGGVGIGESQDDSNIVLPLQQQQQQLQKQKLQKLQQQQQQKQLLQQNNGYHQSAGSPTKVIMELLNTDEEDEEVEFFDGVNIIHNQRNGGGILENNYLCENNEELSLLQQQQQKLFQQQQKQLQQQQQFQYQLKKGGNNKMKYGVGGVGGGANGRITDDEDEDDIDNEDIMLMKSESINGNQINQGRKVPNSNGGYTIMKGMSPLALGALTSNQGLNYDSNELPTIIERELTSQRRSSNGGQTSILDNQSRNGDNQLLRSYTGAAPTNFHHSHQHHLQEDLTSSNNNQQQQQWVELNQAFDLLNQKQKSLEIMSGVQEQQKLLLEKERKDIQEKKQQYELKIAQIQLELEMSKKQNEIEFKKKQMESQQQQFKQQVEYQQEQRQSLIAGGVGGKQSKKDNHSSNNNNNNQNSNNVQYYDRSSRQQQMSNYEESEDDMNDFEVMDYMHQNMDQNQKRMKNIEQESGITDKFEIEKQLVQKLSSLQQNVRHIGLVQQPSSKDPLQQSYNQQLQQQQQQQQQYGSNNKEVVYIVPSEMNSQSSVKNIFANQSSYMNQQQQQDISGFDKKFMNNSNSIHHNQDSQIEMNYDMIQADDAEIDNEQNENDFLLQQQQQQQLQLQQQPQQEQEDEGGVDDCDFAPDPNFLLELNKRMMANDAINQAKKGGVSQPNNQKQPVKQLKDPHSRMIIQNKEYQPNPAANIMNLMYPMMSSEGDDEEEEEYKDGQEQIIIQDEMYQLNNNNDDDDEDDNNNANSQDYDNQQQQHYQRQNIIDAYQVATSDNQPNSNQINNINNNNAPPMNSYLLALSRVMPQDEKPNDGDLFLQMQKQKQQLEGGFFTRDMAQMEGQEASNEGEFEEEHKEHSSIQGQGDQKVLYNIDLFNIDDEVEIIPNDGYYKGLSQGAVPNMIGGSDEDEGQYTGENNMQEESKIHQDEGENEWGGDNDDEENSQNDVSVIHTSNQKGDEQDSASKLKKGGKLAEDEIIRLINEKYQLEESNKEVSIIYKNNKVFDQPKKAVYGIQKIDSQF